MRRFRRVLDINVPNHEHLRNEIDYAQVEHENQRQAMHKDRFLLEAALETDKRIASLDETARALYHILALHVAYLQAIVWVNPDKAEEQCLRWLKEGAKNDSFRCLGYAGDG